jgi:glucosyl-3-phosphoglycerate phosphatase
VTPRDDGPGRSSARVLLIRHGQSTWNAAGRWQGRADPPLSDLGARQARAAAASVGPVVAVWSSDLARARQTAGMLAPPGASVRLEADLRERHVGAWSGLTRADIERDYPGWLDEGRRPDGWEPDGAVARRAWRALGAVVTEVAPGATALVVSHGGLMRAVAAELGESPWSIPNLGGFVLEHDGERFVLGRRTALLDHQVFADLVVDPTAE